MEIYKDRKAWMAVLAKSEPASLAAACEDLVLPADVTEIRAPEIGGVMVRGRQGATGDAFNLGEMTVTRAAIQLADGTIGHGYVQGRDKDHARRAALVDALMQTERQGDVIATVIAPLGELIATRHAKLQTQAAKTKVDFFTMVRAEA